MADNLNNNNTSTTCTKRRSSVSDGDQDTHYPLFDVDIESPLPPLIIDHPHQDKEERVDLLRVSAGITTTASNDDDDTTIRNQQGKGNCWNRICSWTEQLIQRGPAVLLTHFMMSNFAKVVFTTVSWYFYCIRTGKSPLFPDQTQPFLAIFATFLAFDMFLNPIRLAIAMGRAPKMDRLLSFLQGRLCVDSKALAAFVVWIGIVVLNLLLVALGITISSFLAGVPVWEP